MNAYFFCNGQLQSTIENVKAKHFEELRAYANKCAGKPVDVFYDYTILDPYVWAWYYSIDGVRWLWGDIPAIAIFAFGNDIDKIIEILKNRGKWPEAPPKAPRVYIYTNKLTEISPQKYFADRIEAIKSIAKTDVAYRLDHIFVSGGGVEAWDDGRRVIAWTIIHNRPEKAIEDLKKKGLWAEPGTFLKDLGITERWEEEEEDSEVSWEGEEGEEEEEEWIEENEEEGWDE